VAAGRRRSFQGRAENSSFLHAAFNAGLILRQIVGVGKPRRLQDAVGVIFSLFFTIAALGFSRFVARDGHSGPSRPPEFQLPRFMPGQVAA
jgi:hypothetical protein